MTQSKVPLRSILEVGGLVVMIALLAGCRMVSEENTLEAIEKSIQRITQHAGESVVVIDLIIKEGQNGAADSIKITHRYGSGFVYRSDGIIITTDGVIGLDDSVRVITQQGEMIPATLIGRDFETNICVLKINKTDLLTLPLAENSIVNGSLGIMMGNTYYSEGLCCSWGIINRTWIGGGDFLDNKLFALHIQWPEVQSGAPVLNVKGQLIGMAEGHLEDCKSSWTVIPAKTIMTVAEKLIAEGSITRGWLGIRSNPVCPREKTARLMKQWKGKGTVVSSIIPDSPADRIGIQVGDVIVSLNDKPVICVSDFRRLITAMSPGTEVLLDIIRDGEELVLKTRLGRLPSHPERQRRSIRRSV